MKVEYGPIRDTDIVYRYFVEGGNFVSEDTREKRVALIKEKGAKLSGGWVGFYNEKYWCMLQPKATKIKKFIPDIIHHISYEEDFDIDELEHDVSLAGGAGLTTKNLVFSDAKLAKKYNREAAEFIDWPDSDPDDRKGRADVMR